ncbi:sensor histidine kinase [Oxalobacteraceae bacterium CAVE-383]|nr:sensor histidine kinase [Oxalobacteraceae bacterium CAVE-383]
MIELRRLRLGRLPLRRLPLRRLPLRRFSLRRFSVFTLAICYVALSIGVLAVFAIPLSYAWEQTIEKGGMEMLQEDTQRMVSAFYEQGPEDLAKVIHQRVGSQLVGEKILLLTDASFNKLDGNLPGWPAELPDATGISRGFIKVDGTRVRAVLVHTVLPGGYHLLVGRDVNRYDALKSSFFYGLTGAAAVVVLVGVLGGLLIRRTLLVKVGNLRQTAQAIVEGDLSHRLQTQGGDDELDMLAQTVNRMLDQIEHLIHGVRNVSNAIAHDLRTPLTELRFRLEAVSVGRPSAEIAFAEIDSAVADVDRVIQIFNALLRLAEIDTGARRSGFVRVDVAGVARDIVEFYQPVAELKGIALSFSADGGLALAGDPVLLAQAVGNLIDNALKYAQENGSIKVEARRAGETAIELSVADDGPGIPDDEKPKVSKRFYRGDASRGTPGVGLGLSLVSAVAELHGGALIFTDNAPGLRATLRLFATATLASGNVRSG